MFANIELLSPFMLVAYTMWATPGPNNMMLAYSGARFGFKETLPHISGILAGTYILNMLAILGLQPLIEAWPQAMLVLKIIGSIWLLKIGWKMVSAHQASGREQAQRPMAFMAAALFQFANPKAISATLALVSLILVAIEKDSTLIWWVMLIIPVLCGLAITPWVLAGQSIRRFLSTPTRWKQFSWITGSLTASCVIFLWI